MAGFIRWPISSKSDDSPLRDYPVFWYYDDSIYNPVITVIAVLAIYMVNTYAASVSNSDVFVDYGTLDYCSASYSDIWNTLSLVFQFFLVGFVVICTHTIYPVQIGPRLYQGAYAHHRIHN